ncbi:hypothetical protein ACWD0G_13245 [Streptomyces goshikiensis]
MVREYVTNVIRHSGAATREIEVRGSAERVRLVITDDGGVGATPPGSGPAPGRGFPVTAELPVEPAAAAGSTGSSRGLQRRISRRR